MNWTETLAEMEELERMRKALGSVGREVLLNPKERRDALWL